MGIITDNTTYQTPLFWKSSQTVAITRSITYKLQLTINKYTSSILTPLFNQMRSQCYTMPYTSKQLIRSEQPDVSLLTTVIKTLNSIWAVTWQNQQFGCAPNEDSDQPGHPPSLIRAFAVRSMGRLGVKLSSCGQRRLWLDWADAQADLRLRWVHTHFVGFIMSWLISSTYTAV